MSEQSKPEVMPVALSLTISRQFLMDVLCTAVEGGSNYWAAFEKAGHEKGEHGRQYVTITVIECCDELCTPTSPRYPVDLGALAAGMVRLIQGGMHDEGQSPGTGDCAPSYRAELLHAILADDAGHVDANLADLALQAATLKCIRYG